MPTRNITLDHFGTTLEPLWNHFGTTLEPLWDHFGTTLEPRNITLESLDNLSNEACRLLCSHLEEWVSKVWTSWELWLRGPLQKFPMEGRAPAHPFASVCAKAWPVHTQAYGWVDAACCARVRACVHVCMYARFCVYM
jgi:hypothetical protein